MLVSLAGRSVHAEDYSVFLDLHFDIGGVHGSFDRGGSEIDLGGWNTSVGALLYFLSPTGSDNYLGIGVGALYSSDISDWDLSPDVNEIRFTCLKLPVLAGYFYAGEEAYWYLAGGAYARLLNAGSLDPESGSTVYYEDDEFGTGLGLRAEFGFGLIIPGMGAGFGGSLWLEVDLAGPLSESDDSMQAWKFGLGLSLPFFCRGRASFSGQALAGEPWIPGAFCVSGARVRCWQTGRQAIAGPAVHPLIARSSSKQFLHRCEWPSVRWIFRTDTGIDSSYPF